MIQIRKAMLMNNRDNVAMVLSQVNKGETVAIIYGKEIIGYCYARDDIDVYHKIAVRPIENMAEVYKYGQIIGKATEKISKGSHVHISNIEGLAIKR